MLTDERTKNSNESRQLKADGTSGKGGSRRKTTENRLHQQQETDVGGRHKAAICKNWYKLGGGLENKAERDRKAKAAKSRRQKWEKENYGRKKKAKHSKRRQKGEGRE
jgi:hypothetical protein